MEVLRRRRRLADLDIVVRRQLQIPLDARARVLRPLALIPMRQQHHEAGQQPPLRLARRDELVDNDLRAIRKVTKLRLPKHQRLRIIPREPILEAQHRRLRQQRVVHLKPPLLLSQMSQRRIPHLGLRIDHHRMTLVERPTLRVLPGQPHRSPASSSEANATNSAIP